MLGRDLVGFLRAAASRGKPPGIQGLEHNGKRHAHQAGDKGCLQTIKQPLDAVLDVMGIEIQQADHDADKGAKNAQRNQHCRRVLEELAVLATHTLVGCQQRNDQHGDNEHFGYHVR
ncbi:hypothetical protein D3C81_1792830 [compost metagenome]